jgi:serralysin
VTTIDGLLNEDHQKWSDLSDSAVRLSYSFPWIDRESAIWQSDYSSMQEQEAAQHFGLNPEQIAAVTRALQSWADVANIIFTKVSDDANNVGDFRFAYSSDVRDCWGWSYYPDSNWASAGDVWINPEFANGSSWAAGSYNYYSLIHETGHGLGLKHPGNYSGTDASGPYLPAGLDFRNYTAMSYYDWQTWYPDTSKDTENYRYVVPETPMVYDIAVIQYLYGTNNSYQSGDSVYTFDPSIPFYKSIWDAGGKDMIDISNFSTDCTINLIPGSYSSIHYPNAGTGSNLYDGSNNLGIAFEVFIEIVRGGTGNDSITGNIVGNSLYGGAGDDTLIGASGDDTLSGGDGLDTVVFSGNCSEYSISYMEVTQIYTISDTIAGRDDTDIVSGIEQFQFADGVKADILAPKVMSFSPADGAVNAGLMDDIVIIFSEVIQKGTGSVAIHLDSAAGGLLEPAYDILTSENLTISESRLTIKPTVSFAPGTHYVVTLDDGSIEDKAGNSFTGSSTYDFTTADPYADTVGASGTAAVVGGVGIVGFLAWFIL